MNEVIDEEEYNGLLYNNIKVISQQTIVSEVNLNAKTTAEDGHRHRRQTRCM
jgi:hypothetical protein